MNIKVKITRNQNATYFNKEVNSIVQVPLEDYVAAVVGSEVGNSNIQVCKAQAVAARTFAYPYYSKDLVITDSSSSHQAYRAVRNDPKTYANAVNGAKATEGQLLSYNGTIINCCPYSASNGGRIVSSQQRWGGVRAWLVSKDDPWDTGTKNGHGVGMSQKGAKAMAAAGKTYQEILSFYYPGTKIQNPNKEVKKMNTTTIEKFVEAAEYIHKNFKVQYDWGSSGTKSGDVYKSDCRGYAIIWCLRRCGIAVSCPGTNYSIRNQMQTLHTVSSVKDLQVGEVVYKTNKPGDKNYSLYAKYKKGGNMYNPTIGELNSFHIGVVVQTHPSLIIRHCSSGGIKTDTTINTWNYAGFLKYISPITPSSSSQGTTIDIPMSGHETVRRGSKSEDVTYLQQVLTNLNYLNDKIDGIFGSKTKAALQSFQNANGLTADGVCGANTWKKIEQIVKESKPEIEQKPESTKTMTVFGGKLNLRKQATTASLRILQIPNEAEVAILNTETGTAGWYQVSYSGQTGYVLAKYLQ